MALGHSHRLIDDRVLRMKVGGLNYKEFPERDYQWDVGIIQGACLDRGTILCLSVESSLLQ